MYVHKNKYCVHFKVTILFQSHVWQAQAYDLSTPGKTEYVCVYKMHRL